MTRNFQRPHSSFWFVWRMPITLATLTVFGLLAALLGTGAWRCASWLALAAPIAACTWFGLRWR